MPDWGYIREHFGINEIAGVGAVFIYYGVRWFRFWRSMLGGRR